ncbi:MAG: hypothetical protein DMG26_21280 [Acidobacteria bacterium]|nr:MAG: hypothetical protein DMG26_21280 [Acidobacteriota bacterium]
MMQNDVPESKQLAPIEAGTPERLSYPRPPKVTDIESGSEETYSYVRAYWRMLVKHAWTIFTAALVVTTLVAIVSFRMRPVYQAAARLEIEAATPEIRTLSDLFQSMPADDMFLQTQVNVLESDNLAWQTIEQLRLEENPAFNPRAARSTAPRMKSAEAAGPLLATLRGHLHVEIMRNSRIATVSFESTDAALAARVVNTLIDDYQEYNYHKNYEATRKASGWMEQQLDELKAKVEKSEQAVVDYERQNAIISLNDKQNIEEQKLADLSKDLTDAQAEALRADSVYTVLHDSEGRSPALLANDLLTRLEDRYADIRAQYVDARAQYGPNYPKKRIVERYHDEYVAAQHKQQLLSEAVSRQKAELGRLNQLLIQHNILKHEFETNQQLYEGLLQRLKDATLSSGLRATNIHVVDLARTPSAPVRPKKIFNITVGLLVGLVLGVALAFVQEALDDSIKSIGQVERYLATNALAVIPLARSQRSRSLLARNTNGSGEKRGCSRSRLRNWPRLIDPCARPFCSQPRHAHLKSW